MKKAERKLNNQGFSLILVIICMTLIGVLATMILSTAVNNVQMRAVEEDASDNFYSAEEVLDEIKANVEKQANMALGDAYTLFLQKYAATAPKNRESVFIKALTDVLKEWFANDFKNNFVDADFRAKYLGVAKDRSGIEITKASEVEVKEGTDKSTILIKNLGITYTDADGYKTGITTDLVVNITYPKFFEDNAAGPSFLDYSVISDGNIKKSVGSAATVSTISGCVYTGNDLVVSEGANLTVQAPYLIAKNQINVEDGATLSIAGGSLGQLKYASGGQIGLWTKNILTTTKDSTRPVANKLSITGIDSYVQDDLTINGIKDKVSIKGGRYFGYGSGLKDNANTNSAININATNIDLEIINLTHLWLAGQSYISVPLGYGKSVIDTDPDNIMQGESVSFKGNQAAYLLPGDCIEGVWHNPMTEKEYYEALHLITGKTGPDTIVYPDILDNENFDLENYSLILSTRKADSINGDIMNLDQYLNISSPAAKGDYTSRYKAVHVQYQQGGPMVYIYMTFSTPNAAKKFFEEYYSINKDLVDTRMETIGSEGSITIENNSEITATGNLVVHSADDDDSNPNTIIHSNTVATNSEVREADYRYSGYFRNLTMSLDAATTYYGSGDKLTECLFRFDSDTLVKLQEITKAPNVVEVTYGSKMYKLYFGSNVEIDSMNGLVIATGNVHVKTDFNGLIIAQGEVTVEDGITITSAPGAMDALINSNEDLKYFFKYYDDVGESGENKEAIDIYFDNWHKN